MKAVIRSLAGAILLSGLASSAFAQVDERLEVAGGLGGGQYVARCEVGEILNGFELRTGDDVNAIRPICAVPLSPTSIGPRRMHAVSAGGASGQTIQIVCPDTAPTIAKMMVGVEGEKTYVVNNLRLYCGLAAINQLGADHPTVAYDGPEIGINGRFFWGGERCPGGLVAVGIHGKSGIWLDSVGFICGALLLAPPEPPKPAAPAKPRVKVATQNPFALIVEWDRPQPAGNIEWYSIDQVKDKRWVKLPGRFGLNAFMGRVEYPDVRDATERQAFRVCAENSAHRTCSPEVWYYSFDRTQPRLTTELNRASVAPQRGTAVNPNGGIAQVAAAQSASTGRPGAAQSGSMAGSTTSAQSAAAAVIAAGAPPGQAAADAIAAAAAAANAGKLPDLNALAARGAELAMQDPLAAELRNRIPDGPARRGFDVGFGIWEGNAAPGPGKQRVHDALSPAEQSGFDLAAAYSLPRNKYAKLATVGAAIGNADAELASTRNVENDVFFWLGFDIASGIFGDPAAGALGNTATGPGSLGIRNELNAAGQRGFNASTALHLTRTYR